MIKKEKKREVERIKKERKKKGIIEFCIIEIFNVVNFS